MKWSLSGDLFFSFCFYFLLWSYFFLFIFFLPILYSFEGSYCAQLRLKDWADLRIPASWGLNLYINYLGFYCIRDLSILSLISLFNHLFITLYIWLLKLFEFCILGAISINSYISFTYTHQCGSLEHFSAFWHYMMLQDNCAYSLSIPRIRQSGISPMILDFFYLRMILETKI